MGCHPKAGQVWYFIKFLDLSQINPLCEQVQYQQENYDFLEIRIGSTLEALWPILFFKGQGQGKYLDLRSPYLFIQDFY